MKPSTDFVVELNEVIKDRGYNNGKKRASTQEPATPLLLEVRKLNWNKKIIAGCVANLKHMRFKTEDKIVEIWIDGTLENLKEVEKALVNAYEGFKRANPAKKRSYKK